MKNILARHWYYVAILVIWYITWTLLRITWNLTHKWNHYVPYMSNKQWSFRYKTDTSLCCELSPAPRPVPHCVWVSSWKRWLAFHTWTQKISLSLLSWILSYTEKAPHYNCWRILSFCHSMSSMVGSSIPYLWWQRAWKKDSLLSFPKSCPVEPDTHWEPVCVPPLHRRHHHSCMCFCPSRVSLTALFYFALLGCHNVNACSTDANLPMPGLSEMCLLGGARLFVFFFFLKEKILKNVSLFQITGILFRDALLSLHPSDSRVGVLTISGSMVVYRRAQGPLRALRCWLSKHETPTARLQHGPSVLRVFGKVYPLYFCVLMLL